MGATSPHSFYHILCLHGEGTKMGATMISGLLHKFSSRGEGTKMGATIQTTYRQGYPDH